MSHSKNKRNILIEYALTILVNKTNNIFLFSTINEGKVVISLELILDIQVYNFYLQIFLKKLTSFYGYNGLSTFRNRPINDEF